MYNNEQKYWYKYPRAGWDDITVRNYPDVSRDELTAALGGKFPEKATDITRHCDPSRLEYGQLIDLLEDDYPDYMSAVEIHHSVRWFFHESYVEEKTYTELRKLFEDAQSSGQSGELVLDRIKKLSCDMIGRDIFRKEIRIIDGPIGLSYFNIMPARIIDKTNSYYSENIAKMLSNQISIEEDDIAQYLLPFIEKFFDDELEANKNRKEYCWTDDNGQEHATYVEGFEWYVTHNYFSFDSITNMLKDIQETMDALSTGKTNEYTSKLKIRIGLAPWEVLHASDFTEARAREYNENKPKADNTDTELVIDFYRRFIYRTEYMMKVGKEKGFDLITFIGP